VVAENTAPDGRYPKEWDLPAWRKILRSRDVHVVPLEMCQYDLRPESGHGFHRKRTWLVTNAPGLQALMRKCPNTHTHVPMEGRAPGAAQPRTAAAGQYTHAFARAAAESLATTAAHCNARLGGVALKSRLPLGPEALGTGPSERVNSRSTEARETPTGAVSGRRGVSVAQTVADRLRTSIGSSSPATPHTKKVHSRRRSTSATSSRRAQGAGNERPRC
jgi:hypothetical protein